MGRGIPGPFPPLGSRVAGGAAGGVIGAGGIDPPRSRSPLSLWRGRRDWANGPTSDDRGPCVFVGKDQKGREVQMSYFGSGKNMGPTSCALGSSCRGHVACKESLPRLKFETNLKL